MKLRLTKPAIRAGAGTWLRWVIYNDVAFSIECLKTFHIKTKMKANCIEKSFCLLFTYGNCNIGPMH